MKARKTSRRIVREGVSCKYLFQTWRAISWGEDRGERELDVDAFEGVALAEGEDCLAAGGGGFAAATDGVFVAVD